MVVLKGFLRRLGSDGILGSSSGVALLVSTSEGMMGMLGWCADSGSSRAGEPGLGPGLLLSSDDSLGRSPERIRARRGSLAA